MIDALAEAIERVISNHSVVRHLVDNGWLHLWRFVADGSFTRYARGGWQAVTSSRALSLSDETG